MLTIGNRMWQQAANTGCVLAGILAAGLGVKGFLVPNHFIDGGVTGVSMLVSLVGSLSLPLMIAAINVPFLIVGFLHINRLFSIKSALAIAGVSLCLAFIPYPVLTHDNLLAAVFGGFFLGAGIGLAIRGGAVLDGTEIMALILSRKTGATVGQVILVFNVVIFGCAIIVLGLEPALYSMLTYFAASKTVDFIIHGIEQYNGVIIISAKSDDIRHAVIENLGRGVTVLRGYGGFTGAEQNILFCVVTRLEIFRLKKIIHETDPAAFIVIHQITDLSGGMVKKHSFH